MEFNIKKNGTLPLLKMQVVDDGRGEFDSFMSFIETSSLYFSMMDVETGSYKIHLEPAGFVEKTQIDPNAKTEYYIYYKFPKKYTNKVGRYEGEFVLKNTDGTLVLPIREKLYINIFESNVSDELGDTFNLILNAEVSSGSTIIRYTLSSSIPVFYNTTLNFTHTLQTITGSSVVVTTGVTISSLQKVGSVTINLSGANYNNLTQVNTFSNVQVLPLGLASSVDITEKVTFVNPGPTPTTTPTTTPTPTPTLSQVPEQVIDDAIITDYIEYINVGEGYYLKYVNPSPLPTPTVTPTPSPTPTLTPTQTLTPTNIAYYYSTNFYDCNDNCQFAFPTPIIVVSQVPLIIGKFYVPNVQSTVSFEILSSLEPQINPSYNLTDSIGYDTCNESCIGPQPSPTPTNTPTPTVTPSQTPAPLTPFVSIWSADTTIELPYTPSGLYSGTIDWGDGSVSANTYQNRTHTYDTPGVYTVTITGQIQGWNFQVYATSYRPNIKEIISWGTLRGSSNSNGGMFIGCSNLVLTGVTDTPDLVGINFLNSMFQGCSSLTTVNNMNNWDVSDVTQTLYMFYLATNFNQDIGNWNVSGVTSMGFMFASATNFNQDLSNWCVTNILSKPSNFDNGATSWVLPQPVWGTCP